MCRGIPLLHHVFLLLNSCLSGSNLTRSSLQLKDSRLWKRLKLIIRQSIYRDFEGHPWIMKRIATYHLSIILTSAYYSLEPQPHFDIMKHSDHWHFTVIETQRGIEVLTWKCILTSRHETINNHLPHPHKEPAISIPVQHSPYIHIIPTSIIVFLLLKLLRSPKNTTEYTPQYTYSQHFQKSARYSFSILWEGPTASDFQVRYMLPFESSQSLGWREIPNRFEADRNVLFGEVPGREEPLLFFGWSLWD